MKNPTRQMLTGIALTLALGGTLAACGDDETTTNAANPTTSATSPTTGAGRTASAGEIDQAFARQMIPHHEMAVEMARSGLEHADHSQLKTLAKAIIDAQAKEITELKTIRRDLGASSDHSSMMGGDAATLGLSMDAMGMSMDMEGLGESTDFDRQFIDEMTVHHRGAIAMAKVELADGSDARLKKLATAIVTAQEKEIAQMGTWRKAWFGSSEAATTTDEDHGMHHMDS